MDTTSIVKRHVPGQLQSNKPSEEFPIVRDSIARKFPRWMAVVILFSVVTATGGTVSWISIDRNRQAIAAARLAEQGPPPVDALKAITGVWGWRDDFQQSCSQNPHRISTDGNKSLSIKFAKPVWDSNKEVSIFDYTVVAVEPNKLVLSLVSGIQSDSSGRSLRWLIGFSNEDTYDFRRSDRPTETTGDIIRCD